MGDQIFFRGVNEIFFGRRFTQIYTDRWFFERIFRFRQFLCMETENFVLPDLTRAIIGASMEVADGLGGGFLEKVYERALVIELAERGIVGEPQVRFSVHFKGRLVGEYVADLVGGGWGSITSSVSARPRFVRRWILRGG